MSTPLTYRAATRAEAAAVARVARQVAGREAAPAGLAVRVLLPAAMVLLSKVQQAFLVKSKGLRADDGIQWPPLKPATIAARRTTRAELKSLGVTGKRSRGFLTPAEDRRWRAIFAQRLAAFRAAGMDEGAARGRAAANAWAILKSQGAKTKLAVLGSRQVDIGRDTGALLRSLTPGVRVDGQVVELNQPGRLTVGSNVPYAARFHAKRPLWPTDGSIPPAWRQAVGEAIVRGLAAEAGRSG